MAIESAELVLAHMKPFCLKYSNSAVGSKGLLAVPFKGISI